MQFFKSVQNDKEKKTKKILWNSTDLYLGNGLRDIMQIWNVASEANFTVNLVPFGLDITELQMHKNHNFVVPVNILTPFTRTRATWLLCVLI